MIQQQNNTLKNLKLKHSTWEWKKIQKNLNDIQFKIFSAKKNNNLPLTRRLQKLVLNSYDFKKLAVRKITQDNRRKKVAGVYNATTLNETQRIMLVDALKITGKARKLKKVKVIKSNKKVYFIGVPTMYDRALQFLFLFALEPEFEAIFDLHNYCRPVRSPIDAIKQIQLCFSKAEKFVLETNFEKVFEQLDHDKLLDLVGHNGDVRKQIKAWLESGNLLQGTFEKSQKTLLQAVLFHRYSVTLL